MWIRCAAFWMAIAATRIMPVMIACQLSPSMNGPKRTAQAAPAPDSSDLAKRASSGRSATRPRAAGS